MQDKSAAAQKSCAPQQISLDAREPAAASRPVLEAQQRVQEAGKSAIENSGQAVVAKTSRAAGAPSLSVGAVAPEGRIMSNDSTENSRQLRAAEAGTATALPSAGLDGVAPARRDAGTAAALSIVDISAAPPKSGNAGRADLLHVQRHSATVQATHAAWSRLVEHNAPGESIKLKATIQPLCGYACCRGQLLGVCAALITKHGCISGPLREAWSSPVQMCLSPSGAAYRLTARELPTGACGLVKHLP